MSWGKERIGLKLPEQRKPEADSFSTRASAVEEWIQNLPVGNVGETTHSVYSVLHEVNRLILPWQDRYRFLEQLRPSVSYIQSALQRQYIGMSFPLPMRAKKVAQLAQALYGEMALGYKIAIEDMLGANFLNRDKKALVIMLHRAIRYISRSLLTTYQSYATYPTDSWFELHMLYLHAETMGCHQNSVKDREEPQLEVSNIEQIYKQILLLALASPYRLRQGEAESVFASLGRWARHAQFIDYNDPAADDALFVVHMDSDQPPDYHAFDSRDCNNELCRLVNTRELSHILKDELAHSHKSHFEGPMGSNISRDLLKRLTIAWGLAPKRHFNRSERDSSIEVVVGMTAIHQLLAAETDDALLNGRVSKFEGHALLSANRATSDDVWNIFSPKELSSAVATTQEQHDTKQEEQQRRTADIPIHNWHVSNESAGGYRLTTRSDAMAKVQVGEMLAVRQADNLRWEIGVVRWIMELEEQDLELGIQILAPQARPVMVKEWKLRHGKGEYQRALLLPELPAVGIPASLITPIRLFNKNDRLLLHTPANEVSLHLGRIQQDTGAFIQFSYKTDSERQSGDMAGGENKENDEFADLWSEL